MLGKVSIMEEIMVIVLQIILINDESSSVILQLLSVRNWVPAEDGCLVQRGRGVHRTQLGEFRN